MPDEPARIPSDNDLSEVLDALWPCLRKWRYTSRCTWEEEDDWLSPFCRLADALHKIRRHSNAIEGWPPMVTHALRDLTDAFDALTERWGWERIAAPEPERSQYIEDRRAWFTESVARPRYETALAWQARFGTRCPGGVSRIANEGWHLGFRSATLHDGVDLAFQAAESAFDEADKRWMTTPRFGTCYPKIEDQEESALRAPANQLGLVLETMRALCADPAAHQPEGEDQRIEAPASPEEEQDTESRVADRLRDNPRATSRQIAEAIGISEQRVRTTAAWKSNRERLKEQEQQRSVRTRPLSDAMLAVRDSRASDPAAIAAEREEWEMQERSCLRDSEGIEPIEVLQRKYLEGAAADQRARFHRLTLKDKEHELKAWKLTGQRLAD